MENNLLNSLLDRPIAYHRAFVKLGGVTSAVMLSQLLYWSKRTKNSEGWVYKTIKEFQEETGLTRHEQDTARRNLINRKVIEVVRKGVPAKLHYRINFTELQTSLLESGKLDCHNPANYSDGIRQTITEITTEITSKTTSFDKKKESNKNKFDLTIKKNSYCFTDQDKDQLIHLIRQELYSSENWIEDTSQAIQLSQVETRLKIDKFLIHIKACEEFYKPISEIKAHCVNWIKKDQQIQDKWLQHSNGIKQMGQGLIDAEKELSNVNL